MRCPEQMTEEVATNAETFRQYLDTQSRFDRYTANNVLLIMAQRPDAQRLGDYGYWRDQGAFVRRSERRNPVLIMEPGKEYERDDGSIGQYYNAKKVYDITQTNMRVQEEPEQKIEDRTLIRALVNNPPVAIESTDRRICRSMTKGPCLFRRTAKFMSGQGWMHRIFSRALHQNCFLHRSQKGIGILTGMSTLSMPIVRLISFAGNVEWKPGDMISHTLRSSLRA